MYECAQAANPARSDFPTANLYTHKQEELVHELHAAHFWDTCCSLAQTLDANENQSFILLLLDVFAFLFQPYWGMDMKAFVANGRQEPARGGASHRPAPSAASAPSASRGVGAGSGMPLRDASKKDPLLAMLRKEKIGRADTTVTSARHSKFNAQFAVTNTTSR